MNVVQLSVHSLSPAGHDAIRQRLRALRDEGILIVGTGNIAHNLARMEFRKRDAAPFDWA